MTKSIIKIATFVLAVVMMISTVGTMVMVSADEIVYDGTSISTSLSGEGTEASPYLIANGADLAYFATNHIKGAHYKLTNDIVWSSYKNGDAAPTTSNWTPVDDFDGTFDGNGHYVSGVCIISTDDYVGFFAFANGTVKNFTLKDSYVKGTSEKVGGIIGAPHTSKNLNAPTSLVVDNCVNYATVVAISRTDKNTDDIDGVGGIVGAFMCASGSKEGDATYVTGSITNCVNYGKISGTNSNTYAGGITGRLIGFPVSLSNCANFGEISSSKAIAGGIIGQINFTNATDGAIATVSNCFNAGSVEATHVLGGITGRAYANTTLENCVNIGTVTGNAKPSGSNGNKFGSIESTAGATYANNYYLENTAHNKQDTSIAGAGDVAKVGSSKTASEINSADLVAALGNLWEIKDNALTLKVVASAGTVEEEDVEDDEGEDDIVVPTPPTSDLFNADAYTTVLVFSILALISLCAFVTVKKVKKN